MQVLLNGMSAPLLLPAWRTRIATRRAHAPAADCQQDFEVGVLLAQRHGLRDELAFVIPFHGLDRKVCRADEAWGAQVATAAEAT